MQITDVRPELQQFAILMERELQANAHKGTWKNCPPQQILSDVLWHLAKLGWAIKENNLEAIREHSADTANMCMMIADIMGCLDKIFDKIETKENQEIPSFTGSEVNILGRLARHKNEQDYKQAFKRLGFEARIVAKIIMGRGCPKRYPLLQKTANALMEWAAGKK